MEPGPGSECPIYECASAGALALSLCVRLRAAASHQDGSDTTRLLIADAKVLSSC